MSVLPMASGRDLRTPGWTVTAVAAVRCDVPIVHANRPETNDRAEVDRARGTLPGHNMVLDTSPIMESCHGNVSILRS